MTDDAGREFLEGELDRLTYHDTGTGWTVARLVLRDAEAAATIVGRMAGVNLGASLKVWGHWATHARYGRQFVVDDYLERLPATVEGIRKYLGSGLIRGIGRVTADRIVDHFGSETLDLIEHCPERLIEVPGVGPIRARQITRAWREQQDIKDIMLFLQGHGVATGLAVRIYKHYDNRAIAVVRDDPYRLARDVFGIGFRTADRIARRLGLPPDSPRRLEAGVLFTLGELGDEGHVFAPRPALAREVAARLTDAGGGDDDDGARLDPAAIDHAIDALVADGEACADRPNGDEEAVYLPPFYHAEVDVARRLRALLTAPSGRLASSRLLDWDAALAWVDRRSPYVLADRQREAVRTALTRKVVVLTGGPGTGKTTTVRAVLQLADARGCTVKLCAPTGRAAKRLAEATGKEARTIHRLLEFKPSERGRFARDEEHPIDADLVVVDEVSMVDLLLMHDLVRAVPPACHLLLVGDVDQLPSVGAGNVLADLVACGVVPTVVLDQIFRQEATSYIVRNAHRINRGEMPLFERDSTDFFLFPAEDARAAADRVVDVVVDRIPRRFGFDPLADVQVLSPMHRGAAGVTALNERLQAVLNPPADDRPEVASAGRTLRLGDKVMQIRNNYEKGVFNGDLGRIAAINRIDQVVDVDFDGARVRYDFGELDELALAFACSTHKSQGAEYPAVVMALVPAHYMLLQRNLLYTGVTRARRLCVLVGAKRAIAMAVRNDKVAGRHTALARRLRRDG